jgi:UDP-N-acetylmuramoyl-L-alanyl-D-glutamate--2,6-diaminopimelate ligase
VGITGTNGKTTTVTLLYQLFTKLGYKCGLLSTIANYIGDTKFEATHTTPDPVSINSLLSEMATGGCEYCFMEVSSHSLDQQRVAGLTFAGAIFSNITHDHLDYHKTFIEYIKAKKILFDNLPSECFALTNIDDKNGLVMVQNSKAKVHTYSCLSPASFNCRIIENSLDGMLLKIGNKEVWTKFIGTHNAYNLLAVYSTAILLGAAQEETLVALSSLESVSGRLEYIKGGQDITAVVDYAHTPDALENVLKTLSDSAAGREIITVFGCGGDRDKTKRPEMAQVSAKYSDKIIVTSDNPRFEEPEEIIEDIKKGFTVSERARALFITDRREAIRTAAAVAQPGSLILVAGKGHENYQDIKGVKHHFDDKEIIHEIFDIK